MILLLLRMGRAAVRAASGVVCHGRSNAAGEFAASWCEALGPVFIKLGQIASCRPDLLPSSLTTALSRLRERVEPEYSFEETIEAALGPIEDLFAWFDPVPIGSGAVAMVHRGGLRDGRTVAVKVLRRGLRARLDADLRAIETLSGWLERLPGMRAIPFRQTVREFAFILERQSDLSIEAANASRFRRNFREEPRVRFAEPVAHLCCADILTTEYFPDLQGIEQLDPGADGRRRSAVLALRVLFQMIFDDGFIHADLHPGNIYFRETGSIVLLDLGLVAEMDAEDQRRFSQFFFGLVANNGKLCAAVLAETASWLAAAFSRERFEADVSVLVARHFGKITREFEVARFVAELFALLRRHGVRGSTRFMTAILSLMMFEAIAKQLDPDLDFQAEARRYTPLVLRRMLPGSRPSAAALSV